MLEPLGFIVRDEAFHKGCQLAFHYIRELVERETDAMVGSRGSAGNCRCRIFSGAVAGFDLPAPFDGKSGFAASPAPARTGAHGERAWPWRDSFDLRFFVLL